MVLASKVVWINDFMFFKLKVKWFLNELQILGFTKSTSTSSRRDKKGAALKLSAKQNYILNQSYIFVSDLICF